MNLSMKSKSNKGIIDFLKQNLTLFRCFKNVYLFGSILEEGRVPNDIDILLIYDKYPNEINDELLNISSLIEKNCKLYVDWTVLSVCEEKDIGFLQRIEPKYLKLK